MSNGMEWNAQHNYLLIVCSRDSSSRMVSMHIHIHILQPAAILTAAKYRIYCFLLVFNHKPRSNFSTRTSIKYLTQKLYHEKERERDYIKV